MQKVTSKLSVLAKRQLDQQCFVLSCCDFKQVMLYSEITSECSLRHSVTSPTCTRTHTYAHAHAHACTHVHPNKQTHTHTDTQTHRHTRTRTLVPKLNCKMDTSSFSVLGQDNSTLSHSLLYLYCRVLGLVLLLQFWLRFILRSLY